MEPKINGVPNAQDSLPPHIDTPQEDNPFSSPQQLQSRSGGISTPIPSQQSSAMVNLYPHTNVPLKTTEEMLENMSKKIDNIELVVKKIQRHNTISMWLTIIFVILPIVLSIFALPYLITTFTSSFGIGDLSSMMGTTGDGGAGSVSTSETAMPSKQASDEQLLQMLNELKAKAEAR